MNKISIILLTVLSTGASAMSLPALNASVKGSALRDITEITELGRGKCIKECITLRISGINEAGKEVTLEMSTEQTHIGSTEYISKVLEN